jgi:hypothetical protein
LGSGRNDLVSAIPELSRHTPQPRAPWQSTRLSYLGGDDSIDIADIINLIRTSGALAHCDTLVTNLFTQARRNIVDAPHLPPEIRNALAAIWQYMFDLYDLDSEVSRLYLQARPSIQASNLDFSS